MSGAVLQAGDEKDFTLLPWPGDPSALQRTERPRGCRHRVSVVDEVTSQPAAACMARSADRRQGQRAETSRPLAQCVWSLMPLAERDAPAPRQQRRGSCPLLPRRDVPRRDAIRPPAGSGMDFVPVVSASSHKSLCPSCAPGTPAGRGA